MSAVGSSEISGASRWLEALPELGARRPTNSASNVTPAAARTTNANLRIVRLLSLDGRSGWWLWPSCRRSFVRARGGGSVRAIQTRPRHARAFATVVRDVQTHVPRRTVPEQGDTAVRRIGRASRDEECPRLSADTSRRRHQERKSCRPRQTLKRMFSTSPSRIGYVLPSRRWRPRRDASACEPASTRSLQSITSQRMKPRAMSEWIVSAASSAVSPFAERPRARLLLAGGEERDQVERVAQPPHDLVQRRRAAVAERRRLLVVELGQLRLEREVDPARAVLDARAAASSSAARAPAAARRAYSESGVPGVDVREHLAELLDLDAELRVARLRLLLDPLEPPLDVVAVGDEQLELQVLEVAAPGRRPARSRRGRRAARRPGGGCRAARARCRARPARGSRRA